VTAASPDSSTRNAPRRAGAAWFTLFTLAWLAIWTAQLTPLQLLIPLQLNTPAAPTGGSRASCPRVRFWQPAASRVSSPARSPAA
jgi:hypothetical protein